MRLTNKALESSSPPDVVFTEEWRMQEAKEIFNLLRLEYQSSKRLNLMRRYKELERIILMFTSGPVLTKLLWLTGTSVQDSSQSVESETDSDENREGDENVSDSTNLEWQDGAPTSDNKILGGLRNLTTRIKSMGILPLALSFPKTAPSVESDTMSTESTSSPRCFSFDQDYSPRLSVFSTPPVSGVSTPDYPLMSPGASSVNSNCFLFNVGSAPWDPEVASCRAALGSSSCMDSNRDYPNQPAITDLASPATKMTSANVDKCPDADKAAQPRRGIETCIIRRKHVPTFQLPPKRSSTHQSQCLKINTSFYLKPTSRDGAPRKGLNISHSTPNMNVSGLLGLGPKVKSFIQGANRQKRCCSDDCIQQSSVRNPKLSSASDDDYLPGFPTRSDKRGEYPAGFPTRSDKMGTTSISSNMDDLYYEAMSCLTVSSLMDAYLRLTQMKADFEQLNDKNLLARYQKMKTMIKSCMEVHI